MTHDKAGDASEHHGGGLLQREPSEAEMAYVLLGDCEVVVIETQKGNRPVGQWIKVQLVEQGSMGSSLYLDEKAAGVHCNCCQCLLHETDGGSYQIDLTRIPPFSGLEKHVLHKECRRKRSDAALLMGLLRAVKNVVSVQQCLVQFRNRDGLRCTLAITLSFPNLLLGKPGERSILPGRRSRGSFNKPLDPALQLLLTVVRSDWETLALHLDKPPLAACHNDRRERPPFFPNKVSLEFLYSCLPSSTDTSRKSRCSTELSDPCQMLGLPKEILVERLAPFLDAKSLDALRCSCSFLHGTLKAVVPGLKLSLFSHQIRSLCWMRERECRHVWESDCLKENTPCYCPDDDFHRAISGGSTVLLRERSSEGSLAGSQIVRISQCFGSEVNAGEAEFDPRSVARGGLLCDDPGLGKTITLLSLFLQTYGLSTTPTSRQKATRLDSSQATKNVEDVFKPYWAEMVTHDYRRPLLNKLINTLLRNHSGSGFIPAERREQIRRAIQNDFYGSDFSSFEQDVEEAIELYAPDDEEKTGTRMLLSEFRVLVEDLKNDQMRSAKKSFSNTSGRHKSRFAAVIARQSENKFLDCLIASAGTLLVIPHVLMEHWQTQIFMHVDLNYLSRKTPLVFEFGKSEKKGMSTDEAAMLCQVHKTHAPLVFLDRGGTRPLPPADFLAMFRLVITSTDRFSLEWGRGSFRSELQRSELEIERPSYWAYSRSEESCPLLKVHWLRLVVDEGHSMGKGPMSSAIQFALWVSAQRRWAMTGTPTKQTSSELTQVKGLLSFLKHDFFSSRVDGVKWWENGISRPWRGGALASYFRLKSLLSLLMKRHTKLDIAELLPPRFEQTVIPMSFVEATTYNTLVCGVQSNILITSMEGKTSGEQDSLLHRSQAKHARNALANIRRVCIGWSRVIPTLTLKTFLETISLLESHGFSKEGIAEIRLYLFRPEEEKLTPCGCCGLQLSTPLLLPCCGGLICTECMDSRTTTCLLCSKQFDVDDFQLLQPGFVYTWKSNLETLTLASAVDPTSQGHHPPARHNLLEGPVIRHPQEHRRRTRKRGDGHVCEYDNTAGDGVCTLCGETHDSCNLFNAACRCHVCHRVAQECPPDESKAAYLVQKLERLLIQALDNRTPSQRPPKVIVYSQFRKALNVVGDRLLKRFGTACISEYWGRFRSQELRKFTIDSDCFCMLLSNDGSEGLDLSFVTHLFFLEEIWDTSLRDQAVARAWRMGAKGRVEVETLLAKNSVEETMHEIESALRGESHDENLDSTLTGLDGLNSLKEYQQAKTKILLRSLRLITDYHYFAKSDSSSRELEIPPSATTRTSLKRKRSVESISGDRPKRVRFQLPSNQTVENGH